MENPLELASVLVVEDEQFSQDFIVQLLKWIGLGDIETADNGAEALEKLAARGSAVDLIITDVSMPEMDGYELIRRVRLGAVENCQDVPIIVLPSHDTEKNVRHARVLKIDSFFVKPPSKVVFERAIRRIVADRIKAATDAAESP